MAASAAPTGTVLALAAGQASVRIDTSGCQGCGHGAGCGIGRLAAHRAPPTLVLAAPPGLRVGDRVELCLPAAGLTRLALLGYLLPALAMLLGAASAHALTASEAASAGAAGLGGLAALILVRRLLRHAPGLAPAPQLKRVLPAPPASLTDMEPHHER